LSSFFASSFFSSGLAILQHGALVASQASAVHPFPLIEVLTGDGLSTTFRVGFWIS